MKDWIKVEDALPEKDQEVLVYNPHDGINLGEYDEDQVSFYIEKDGSKFYTDSGWDTCYCWAPKMSPTHWMPLPEEPK